MLHADSASHEISISDSKISVPQNQLVEWSSSGEAETGCILLGNTTRRHNG